MKRLTLSLLVLLLGAPIFASEIERSYDVLPFGNGIGSCAYQLTDGKSQLMYFYEHIYKSYEEGETTMTYIKRGAFWGIKTDEGAWLNELDVLDCGYINGTGIAYVEKNLGDLDFTEYYFMPMESDKRILVSVLSISNTGAEAVELTPYFYHDFGMGGGAKSRGETAEQSGDFFIESREEGKDGRSLVYLPFEYENILYQPKEDIKDKLLDAPGKVKKDKVDDGDSIVGYTKFGLTNLAPGESTEVLVIFGLCEYDEEEEYITTISDYLSEHESSENVPASFIESEEAFWTDWHSATTLPENLSEEEKKLFLQSAAVLKMGQCREEGPAYGQILASMPPGMWNIAWVRDGAYSLVALAQSGHYAEAKAGLEFMMNGSGGTYTNEEYVGMDYLISVCRYWGNGEEESDWNDQGPNIEWDDFGLFLWAFSTYVNESGDQEFLNTWYNEVKTGVADVLVHVMSEDGYLIPDSSIWERHWSPSNHPDGKESFSYSTINAINGLTLFSELAPTSADRLYYSAKASSIKSGFLGNFIQDGVVVQSLEEYERGLEYAMDASGVEAINFDIISDSVAETTLAAWEENLRMENTPGFLRNDDSKDYEYSWYDEQEWVVIDLRIAHAYYEIGETERAEELMTWVLDNAIANSYVIAELLAEEDAAYEGAIPMLGFGAGAYIINCYQMRD